jgi:cytochrome c oxidase cbb3-type subunit 2
MGDASVRAALGGDLSDTDPIDETRVMTSRLHRDHRAIVAFAAIGYLVLTLVIAILPASKVQGTLPLPGAPVRSAEAERGRQLYLKEGCGFCHTQFVRDLPMDRPFGRASLGADYAREAPALLGSERTGPDLANVGARQPSEVWHLIHLYNPRAVVPQSVMPAYAWYFESKEHADASDVVVPVPKAFSSSDKVIVATPDALALTRYLLSLRQFSPAP